MKYFIISILILLVIVLGYIYQTKNNQPKIQTPNLLKSQNICQTDEDCKTPMDFLIQSNCPFESACIQGNCQVVCPLPNPNPNTESGDAWSLSCQENADCDCSDRAERSKACICHQGKCLSVETN